MKSYNFGSISLLEYLKNINYTTTPKKITKDMVSSYIELTGDNNPIHSNLNSAQISIFREPVVHGELVQLLSIKYIYEIYAPEEIQMIQVYRSSKNLRPTPVDSVITFNFTTKSVELMRNTKRGEYLNVVYYIQGFVENKKVIEIEWNIQYQEYPSI